MNRWNSESHQARLNGRVVTEEDEVNHDYDDIRRSQSRLRRYHQSATLRAEASSKDVYVEPCSPVCTICRTDRL